MFDKSTRTLTAMLFDRIIAELDAQLKGDSHALGRKDK